MKKASFPGILLFLFILSTAATGFSQVKQDIFGKWTLIQNKSSSIGLYKTLGLEIQQKGDDLTIIQQWGRGRNFTDTLIIKINGKEKTIPVTDRVFPSNVFMGISMQVGAKKKVSASWEEKDSVLKVFERFNLHGSQGLTPVVSTHVYRLSKTKELLEYEVYRSSREDKPALTYILKPTNSRNAYFMKLNDGWTIDGLLPENAFLISLQGIANLKEPNLYFIYPENYPFTYTNSVFEFYRDKRYYSFTELKTPEQALTRLIQNVKGYVIWDKSVRTSLIVAYTVAGLEQAVVVSEEQIPMVEKAGLKPVEDFRGKFTGQTDAQIYQWAYDNYWDSCSRDFIIWLGGPHGNVVEPGVADWGIYKKAFFNDLSSLPADKEEYELSKKLLSQMNPHSMVMGWHSYKKDKERDHVTLTSNYGLRVEGLQTLPNISFSNQVSVTPGYKFKNNHKAIPGKKYIAEKKVYIAVVQTDGIGLGAWLKPGRGEIPYTWKVGMNFTWLAPAMLEYFYKSRTPNDFFVGNLSGPGYMYPKAVPPDLLPPLIKMADTMMKQLDLNVFAIMDYSEGATVEGNTELTKEVVDAYYKYMPDAIGFLNGYAPAYSFAVKDGRPLISYDYYLDPSPTEEEAANDLIELASINSGRPYFLLMHIRQTSDVVRVKNILEKLGPEFEVVPLDIFLNMTGQNPTFEESYLKR